MKNRYEIRGDTTVIFLDRKNGDVIETIIDTKYFGRADEFPNKWCAVWEKKTDSFYVSGSIYGEGTKKTIIFHRWLLLTETEKEVDHIDHDTLNNREINLRELNTFENQQNRKGNHKKNKSGVRGVYWHERDKKWVAQLTVNRKKTVIGYFNDLEEARVRITEARKMLMPFSNEIKEVVSL